VPREQGGRDTPKGKARLIDKVVGTGGRERGRVWENGHWWPQGIG